MHIGIVFEGTYIPLRKWFYAIYLFISHKKGISSAQLAREMMAHVKCLWSALNKNSADFYVIKHISKQFCDMRLRMSEIFA